jgi:predicted SAM-dependent methyltransferase
MGIRWRLELLWDRARRAATPAALRRYDRLHLGAGARQIPGWANLDIAGRGNLIWDLRKPLPLEAGQIRFVYSEHFIEHITRADALLLLKHARHVLAADGVIRISTPNLATVVDYYRRGELMAMQHGNWFPKTPCQMVNESLRLWGHTFVYDEPELRSLLSEAGFCAIARVAHGKSEYSELCGLETRPDFDDLIFEARR